MTQYVFVSGGAVLGAPLDLTQVQLDKYTANGKAASLRLWIVDLQPTPTASQMVDVGPITVSATEAHQTWTLRGKTQAELDADTQATEVAALKGMLTALNTDIAAGITAAPTTAAQAFVEIQDLKRRALRTDRAIRWLIKQQG